MTCDCYDFTPNIAEYINVLRQTDCPFTFYTSVLIFGILPFCTVLYLALHHHKASIRGLDHYHCVQSHLLISLVLADVASIVILAWCVSNRPPFMLPIIAADVCLVPYVCGCVLIHHMSFIAFPQTYRWPRYLLPAVVLDEILYGRREQETDWADWDSQDTTLYCDDRDDERIDHHGDTEPLLQEWLAEQERLNQTNTDEADDDTESTLTTYSPVNAEQDLWFSNGNSGYGSDDSSPADSFLLPAAMSD